MPDQKKFKKAKVPSELRFDMISKDWVVIATGRSKRPETFKREKRQKEEISREKCPFCQISVGEKPTLAFYRGKKIKLAPGDGVPKKWTTISMLNKYPAFAATTSLNERADGPHQLVDAYGFQEVIITGDHKRQMAQFGIKEIKEVIDVYQERYLDLMNEKLINYVSIFHNHGVEAGASVAHPHSQIIAAPVLDPEIHKSLIGAGRYFSTHKKCIHCMMNEWDRKDRKRVIFENKEFLVICPFASKAAFEMAIVPKTHLPYFERMNQGQKEYLAEAFQAALNKLYRALNDPPYNFFLHTAPCDGKNYNFYHWHWAIIPKTATWAGFELCTGIEISTIEPERAAEYLRKQ